MATPTITYSSSSPFERDDIELNIALLDV